MWRFEIFPVFFLSSFCLAVPPFQDRKVDAKACQCVPPHDCFNGYGFYSQYARSSTGFALRKLCENDGQICCRVASATKRERRFSTQENPPLIEKCEHCNTDDSNEPVIIRNCGLRNPEGLDRNDSAQRNDEAKFGEFPWMVALLAKGRPNERGKVPLVFSGGGSLVHPKAVITAAHCVANRYTANRLVIRAGEWDPRNKNEYLPHRHRDAEKIIVHEDYYESEGFHSDYAIIILKAPFELAPHIGLACLPDRMNAFDPSRCISTGWGRKIFAKGPDEIKILKKVELPLVPKYACMNTYRKFRNANFFLHPSYLCAGGEYGKDMCSFDSGGPLVCPILDQPTRYVLVGIVAAGPRNCGTEGLPGYYSDVTFGRRWILRQLARNGLRIDAPTMPS